MSGYLHAKEGIGYPGRIWIGQVAQIVVTIMGVLYAGGAIVIAGGKIEDQRQELAQSLTQEEVEELSNYEWATITVDDLYVTSAEQALLDTLPTKWCDRIVLVAVSFLILTDQLCSGCLLGCLMVGYVVLRASCCVFVIDALLKAF